MNKKIFNFLSVSFLAIQSAAILSGCDLSFLTGDKLDAKLYHLTLSSNKTLTNQQKSELKATYGYGEPSPVVKEGVRDPEDIEALKEAGATDEDIAKAGKRQSDGSYYFFDQDPIYLEAPQLAGYKFTGFYFKNTNDLAINPIVSTDIDGNKYLTRWNMRDKDTNLEARYEKFSYHPYFNNSLSDETNPNSLPDQYCYVDQGDFALLPATSTSSDKTFVSWYYEKYVDDVWTTFYIDKLPNDYYEDSLRIQALWEYKKIEINFDFELYIDPDTSQTLTWDDVFESVYAKGNLTYVNGVRTMTEQTTAQDKGLELKKDDKLEIQASDPGQSSWLDMFLAVKPGYKIWRYQINSGDFSTLYEGAPLSAYYTDFGGRNSTIKFQIVYAD